MPSKYKKQGNAYRSTREFPTPNQAGRRWLRKSASRDPEQREYFLRLIAEDAKTARDTFRQEQLSRRAERAWETVQA